MTTRSRLLRALTLVVAGASLAGCVAYPAAPYYGRGYGYAAPSYRAYSYAAPAYGRGYGYGYGGYGYGHGGYGYGRGWR